MRGVNGKGARGRASLRRGSGSSRRNLLALATLLAPFAGLLACSAFEAEDTPAQVGDAGNGGGDGGDALADSSQISSDAGGDGGALDGAFEAAPVDAATPVCMGSHWICDNFDQVDSKLSMTSGDTWNEVLAGVAFTELSADSGAPSPPNVLKVTSDPNTRAWFSVTKSAAIKGLHCKTRMKVAQVGAADSIVFEILLTNGADNYRASVMTASGGGALVSHGGTVGGSTVSPSPLPVPLNGWTQIDMSLKVGPSAEISVFMNGDSVLATSLGAVAFVPAQVSFTIGSSVYGISGMGWVHLFDDVVCDSIL